uniref:Transposase n=1 Tax=uncultured Sphingobacteriia bacterium TaxID=246143 RepID=F4MLZ4_9BACT|nr:hypothetical protein S3_858_0020 [uncultured Sphingobacteriia bacterium]
MLHRYKKKATTQMSGRFSKYKLSLKYNLIMNVDLLGLQIWIVNVSNFIIKSQT